MDHESIERVLAQIVEQGDEYGELATYVSDSIELIEARLNEAGGKLPFQVIKNGIALRFNRRSDDWKLWVIDPCSAQSLSELTHSQWDKAWRLLSESRALTKAVAITVLPEMLASIAEEQQRIIREIKHTLGTSESNPIAKGGA
jgi:hypothetical protein